MERNELDKILKSTEIRTLSGTPLGDCQGFYLDIVLSTSDRAISIAGTAAELSDRTEAFFLTASEFDEAQRWIGVDGPGWGAEDIMATWSSAGEGSIWRSARCLRYFRDAEDVQRGVPVQGPFDSAAAIEVSSTSGADPQRIVFYATYEYPCAVEVATTTERCDAILAGLEEFVPGSSWPTIAKGE